MILERFTHEGHEAEVYEPSLEVGPFRQIFIDGKLASIVCGADFDSKAYVKQLSDEGKAKTIDFFIKSDHERLTAFAEQVAIGAWDNTPDSLRKASATLLRNLDSKDVH